MNLALEHRWLVIGSMLTDLMGREALDMEREGRKDYEIVEMLIGQIDWVLTEEFKQTPLTETEIVKLIEGIDIIVAIAEAKVARIQQQERGRQ